MPPLEGGSLVPEGSRDDVELAIAVEVAGVDAVAVVLSMIAAPSRRGKTSAAAGPRLPGEALFQWF
jgi:hypothetical protein